MKKAFIFIAVVVVLLGLSYYVKQQRTAQSNPANESQVDQVYGVDQFIQSSPDTAVLQAGGSSYNDPQGVFGFLYPNEYAIDHQEGDKYTRISKKGATQKGQTEMYDGVIVVFERINLEGKTLNDWVDQHIQESTGNGMSELTQPKKTVTLNDYSGYTYEIRGLGTSTYLVLRKDPNSDFAVSVTSLVADPEQKNYQKEVDAILSTLELRK